MGGRPLSGIGHLGGSEHLRERVLPCPDVVLGAKPDGGARFRTGLKEDNSGHLGGSGQGDSSGHHTSSLAGGAHNGLKGARFGVWVGGRPVSGPGTWEGDNSGNLGGSGQIWPERQMGDRPVSGLGERVLPCSDVVPISWRPQPADGEHVLDVWEAERASRHLGGRGFCRGTVQALGRERLLPCRHVQQSS